MTQLGLSGTRVVRVGESRLLEFSYLMLQCCQIHISKGIASISQRKYFQSFSNNLEMYICLKIQAKMQ